MTGTLSVVNCRGSSLQSPTSVKIFFLQKKIKSSLYSLNTLSGVTSERCPSPRTFSLLKHIQAQGPAAAPHR